MPDDETDNQYEAGVKNGIYQTEIKHLAKSIEELKVDLSGFRDEFNSNLTTVMDAGRVQLKDFTAEVKTAIKDFPCAVHSNEFTKIQTSLSVLRWVGGIFIILFGAATPYIIYLLKVSEKVPIK